MQSEKNTKQALITLLGKDTVFLTQKNAYGDRRKYAFGFWIGEVAKRYNAIDKAEERNDRDIVIKILTKKCLMIKDRFCEAQRAKT